MAKKSFNERVPAFKYIFLFALVVSVPLTMWSLSSAPTETRSSAATVAATCTSTYGAACYKYSCPTTGGYFEVTGSCGSMTDSACCTAKLATPSKPEAKQWYCSFGTPVVEHDSIGMSWNKVPYATSYTVYHRIYTSDNRYAYKALAVGNQTSYIYNGYTKLNGRHIQLYVVAYRGSVKSANSPVKITDSPIFESCPQ